MGFTALTIALLGCACYGRRVQSPLQGSETDSSSNDLATLLFATSPAAATATHSPLRNPSIAHSQTSFNRQRAITSNSAATIRMSDDANPLSVGNNLNLKGKVAFLCGASSEKGFGWAIAKELADAGATVIFGTWPMGC